MNVILNFLTFVSSSIRWKSRNIKNFSFDIFDFEKNVLVRVIVTMQSKHIWFFPSTTHKNWSSIISIQRYVIIQNLLWSYNNYYNDLKANVAYFSCLPCEYGINNLLKKLKAFRSTYVISSCLHLLVFLNTSLIIFDMPISYIYILGRIICNWLYSIGTPKIFWGYIKRLKFPIQLQFFI